MSSGQPRVLGASRRNGAGSAGSWSTHQLAEFVAAVSVSRDAGSATRGALEKAAEALDADFAAIVQEDRVTAALGFAAGSVPEQELLRIVEEMPADPVQIGGTRRPRVTLIARLDRDLPTWLLLGRDAADPFTGEEHTLVRAMVRVLALGLRSIETVSAMQERQVLFERLATIQRSITQRADLQETLDAIVAGAAELVEEPIAVMRLLDESDPGHVTMVSSVGVPDDVRAEALHSPVGEGASGQAIDQGRLVVINDYGQAENTLAVFRGYAVQAAMSAPVREQGKVVGSLTVATGTVGRRFNADEQEALLSLCEHASLAVTDARMVSDAIHQAMHDTLTGLPNRALFLDRVEHAMDAARRRGTRVAVLFLDLDHFKVVNDSLGHQAGDNLLIGVADRLRSALRRSDTVARFGGDEFGILAEDIRTERDAVKVAEQIASAFVTPFPLDGREHFASPSIGIALADAAGGESPAALIRNADAAMYRAKARGRGGYELYDATMRARALNRLRVESELRSAVARDELRLDFQPIVSLADGKTVGAEALVRWQHPERGLLSPVEFIGVAEESGLIVSVGEWVLTAACREAAAWAQDRPDGPPTYVSVNLSPRQVGEARLTQVVADTLAQTGLDPALLALEITESVLLEDAAGPKVTLREIKDLGVHLVLDDFGTGYSSLGYLKRLPLDGIKIDRSFVSGLGSDPDDSAIVSAVAGMATGLGLQVIAEGVQSEGQADELRRMGCGRAQGFHYARPLPPALIRAHLAAEMRMSRR
jgi:diguanylate cyclase (GGDEF)-like protein